MSSLWTALNTHILTTKLSSIPRSSLLQIQTLLTEIMCQDLDLHSHFKFDLSRTERLLLKPCIDGNLAQLRTLLKKPHFIATALESRDRKGLGWKVTKTRNLKLMLYLASRKGHAAIVQFLFEFGHNHTIPYEVLITANAIKAVLASENIVDVFRKFVEVDPGCVCIKKWPGRDVLSEAIRTNNFGLAEMLFESGVALLYPSGNRVGVGLHVERGGGEGDDSPTRFLATQDVAILKLWLEHGGVVERSGALHAAVLRDRTDSMALLLEYGADVDEVAVLLSGAEGTPLHEAVGMKRCKAAGWLLDHGADLYKRDNQGFTPLDLVGRGGGEDLKEVFEKFLRRTNRREGLEGRSF